MTKLIWDKLEEQSFLEGEANFIQLSLRCQKQKIRMTFAFNVFAFPYPFIDKWTQPISTIGPTLKVNLI